MANTPRSTGTDPLEDSPTTTAPAGPSVHTTQSGTAVSTRSRWVLSSIAGVGILSLGLLGGMLIGQQMVPTGMHSGNIPPVVFMNQGDAGQGQQIPGELKERMKDRMADQLKQRRDQLGSPGELSPAPSPDNG